MSQDNLVKLRSSESTHMYWSRKNKKGVERKLELKKYDPKVRKHVVYKEVKK